MDVVMHRTAVEMQPTHHELHQQHINGQVHHAIPHVLPHSQYHSKDGKERSGEPVPCVMERQQFQAP